MIGARRRNTMGRFVEIGELRELVEVLDEPRPAPDERIGRIKHRNGENVQIDFDTLERLVLAAQESRRTTRLFA